MSQFRQFRWLCNWVLCEHDDDISHLLTGSRLETEASDYLTTRRLEERVYRPPTEGRRLEVDNNRTAS